ncbi:MAG: metalloprotease TldD [Coxiellaceae bacterium]|jgi:TldD protein|nr:metalloprotease TldD [Coxiellaceae bacterium]
MNSSVAIAKKLLLEPGELTEEDLYKILTKIIGAGVDSSDIYLQYSQSEAWSLEDGLIKRGSFDIEQGFGIHATCGDTTGFAHAAGLAVVDMKEAASSAAVIVKSGSTNRVGIRNNVELNQQLYAGLNPLHTLSENQKISLLKEVDAEARKYDPRVVQVNASLAGLYKVILVANSDGTLATDVRPLIHMSVSVLVEEHGRKEHGNYGGGRRSGYEIFLQEGLCSKYAKEAVRAALVNLRAIPAPAGIMPVVLGAGFPAVMLHEAVGHGLEADFNRKGYSVYSGKIGEKVASSQVSIIDQGNLPNGRRGSLNIDDEGTPTQRTVLIENGILCSYMYDKLNARLMNNRSTGNGRRSSYADIPIPRMTNTFMLPGKYEPSEIIESVARGIYAVNFTGGQVDITSGEFVFSTSEAYLIEKGKITNSIRGATLIGNGPQVLNKVVMVGSNLELDPGIGTCGKSGQNVPVGIGQPTLKISELTVGGTSV